MVDVVEHAERVVNLGVSEPVAVVPFPDLVELLGVPVVRQHVADLPLRESESLSRPLGEHVVHDDAVQAGEHLLLGDPGDAGDVCQFDAIVVLQGGGHKIAEELRDWMEGVSVE